MLQRQSVVEINGACYGDCFLVITRTEFAELLFILPVANTMIERFEGESGRRRLIQCLERQEIIRGDSDLASALADVSDLIEVEAGEAIIDQDGVDNSLFLIIAGQVSVVINGREIAIRRQHQHVGDMALIDPSARRSATVLAQSRSIYLKISEPVFSALADANPELWRHLAIELGSRLRQRNIHVPTPNPTPVVFIGSSVESLDVARAIRDELQHDDVLTRLWSSGGVFGVSHFAIDDLLAEVAQSDFAVLVLGPDDEVQSREDQQEAPRDNVVFELGLFMGALGKERTLMVRPRDIDIKIPTDLLGLNPASYRSKQSNEISQLIGPAANTIRQCIRELGPK